MSLVNGTAYLVDTTISAEAIADSPAEIRTGVTVTVDSTGTLIVRSVEIADLETEMDLHLP